MTIVSTVFDRQRIPPVSAPAKREKSLLWLLKWLSPRGLLLLAFVSYFYLLNTLTFAIPGVVDSLSWLGGVTVALSVLVINYRIGPIVLDRLRARRLLRAVILVFFLLAVFLGKVTGWGLSSLLDERFAIPAYGVIFSMFFIGALLGTCALTRYRPPLHMATFLVLLCYVGIIAGGKGFFAPAIFGLTLAALCGLYKPRMRFILPALAMGAASVVLIVLSVVGDLDLVWTILETRLIMSADAVSWLSGMSAEDVANFPISATAFVVDLFARFIGARINAQSVGSVMATIVVGDDSGAGPNPTLPVLALLINQGDLAYAMIFVVATFVGLALVISGCRDLVRRYPGDSIYFAAVIFVTPTAVIDIVMFLQQIFCVLFFWAASKVLGIVTKR